MRIVAGEYSSRKLETLKGNATRPTLDKVREAVFSSLGGFFDGGCFLDLYSGSGAVGLEALSRGMDQVVLNDKARDAVGIIKTNVKTLKCEDRTVVLNMPDTKALHVLKEKGYMFDLVYLDPPYAKEKNQEIMQKLQELDLLKEHARVVVESLKEDQFDETIGRLHCYKTAVYGISKISYYRLGDEK